MSIEKIFFIWPFTCQDDIIVSRSKISEMIVPLDNATNSGVASPTIQSRYANIRLSLFVSLDIDCSHSK